ncbi:hypothetical protein SKAU_G00138980 [Synaphobranchus kaupii]|uniref:Uncharacterized protein n=1 Tax=Synaphobranchus kaupii TaxID=118154 RepID=A0A9Q1FSX1_SYNKA|nr:hypothetical protein SKAU_G00138980 [Synaphobranchus kaupii]
MPVYVFVVVEGLFKSTDRCRKPRSADRHIQMPLLPALLRLEPSGRELESWLREPASSEAGEKKDMLSFLTQCGCRLTGRPDQARRHSPVPTAEVTGKP